MTYWIQRRFRVITPEEIKSYRWLHQTWVKIEPTPIKTHVIDIFRENRGVFERLRERREAPSSLEKVGTYEEPVEIQEAYQKNKSYIVWYSHGGGRKKAKYSIRREIAIYYWVSPKDTLREEVVTEWLNTAVKKAMGYQQSASGVLTWHGAYFVLTAFTSELSDREPYDYRIIKWTYTSDNQIMKKGEIYRW